jgi:hypothetical protein
MELLGFWSYVHADDETEMGRVVQLARDIVSNYEALRAESIKLFLSRDDLHWGDSWRGEINDALTNVAFFVPILTPRWFHSAECRREFQYFVDRASRLGVSQLIMPILYIDVAALHEDVVEDPIVATLKDIQWQPWTDLRFKERSSEEYRRAVSLLAEEMSRRVAVVETVDVIPAIEAEEEEEAEGFLDKVAALEEAMPRWAETLQNIQTEIENIGSIVSDGARDMNRGENQGKGFAARLTVARRLANELSGPAERLEILGQEFATDLTQIDVGFRAVVDQSTLLSPDDTEEVQAYLSFVTMIKDLSASANGGLGSIGGLVDSIEPIERMSKDMRPPLRRLRKALTSMVEARAITDSWMEVVGRAPDPAGLLT